MNEKYLFLVQARLGSTRLPEKVLKPIYGDKNLIEVVYERILKSKYANKNNVIILTTESTKDDKLIEYLESKKIRYYRGSEKNVYKRFYSFLKENQSEYFFRICSDNPLIDPSFLDNLVTLVENNSDFDYCSYEKKDKTPAILTHYGLFAELLKTKSFIDAEKSIVDDYDKEHVTPHFYTSKKFKNFNLLIPEEIQALDLRLTVDTISDFNICKKVLSKISMECNYKDILEYLYNYPEVLAEMKLNIEKNKK